MEVVDEEVKLDPYEVKKEPLVQEMKSLTMWNFLVKRSRYLYKTDSEGQSAKVNRTKLVMFNFFVNWFVLCTLGGASKLFVKKSVKCISI